MTRRAGVGRQDGARRGFLLVATGTGVAQLLGAASVPLLTRLYSPADFATFTIVYAVTVVGGVAAAGRYDLAVVLPVEPAVARRVVALGLRVSLGTWVVGSVVVLLAGRQVEAWFGQPLLPWLWAAPAGMALMGAYLCYSQLAARERRFGLVGRRAAVQVAVMVVVQVAAGPFTDGPGGLVVGMLVGQAAAVLSLHRAFRHDDAGGTKAGAVPGRGPAPPSPAGLAAVARRYRRFPLLLAPQGVANALGVQLPLVLVGLLYDAGTTGQFGMVQRVLALPVTLVGTAAGQVFLSEIAARVRDRSAGSRALLLRASRLLVVPAVALAGVLLVGAPALFTVVFGPEWATAGDFARLLALPVAAQMVAAPLSQVLVVTERQLALLVWDGVRIALMVAVAVAARAADWAPDRTVAGLAAVLLGAYVVQWFLSLHAAARSDARATTR